MRAPVLAAVAAALAITVAGPRLAVGDEHRGGGHHGYAQSAGTITVIGAGQASAVPDLALLSVGVETTGETAGDALTANSDAARAVIDALTESGIERRDIQTERLSVSPVYTQDRDRSTPPVLSGYRVVNQVGIRVRDVGMLGAVIDQTVSAGANRVDSIRFDLSDPDAALADARRAAIADALDQAALYADAAGVSLGPIRRIRPVGGGGPGPRPMATRAMADAAPPVEAGETSVTARVEVVFALGTADDD